MINFSINTCPKCGQRKKLMFSNNPLSGSTICFDCINKQLDFNNLEHAEFFCRSYNLPWKPEIWLSLIDHGNNIFEDYTTIMLEDKENHPNLSYESSTRDL